MPPRATSIVRFEPEHNDNHGTCAGIGIWGHAAATVRPHRFVGHTIIVPGCGTAPLGARDTGQLPKCAQWTGHVALYRGSQVVPLSSHRT